MATTPQFPSHMFLQCDLDTSHHDIESIFSSLWIWVALWLFLPLEYGRSHAIQVLVIDHNWPGSFHLTRLMETPSLAVILWSRFLGFSLNSLMSMWGERSCFSTCLQPVHLFFTWFYSQVFLDPFNNSYRSLHYLTLFLRISSVLSDFVFTIPRSF